MHLTAKSALVAGATALAATSFALPVARAQDAEPVAGNRDCRIPTNSAHYPRGRQEK